MSVKHERQLKPFYALLLTAFSCCQYSTEYLPASVGGPDEVLFIMENESRKGPVGDSILDYFQKPYPALPQYEPMFKVRFKHPKQFTDILKKYHTIVLLGDLQEHRTVTDLIKKVLGAEQFSTVRSDLLITKHDIWSKPQTVFFLLSHSADPIALIGNKRAGIIEHLSGFESGWHTKRAYATGSNGSIDLLLKKHKIDLPVPKDYFVAHEDKRFIWIKKETQKISSNILVYYESGIPEYIEDFFREKRDSLCRQHIKGELEGTYMVIEDRLPMIQTLHTGEAVTILESRGLWKMENDFMGGPFINYTIADKLNDRTVFIDGFVFAPGTNKKKLIEHLKAILSRSELLNDLDK